ncbi:hypothetical protein EDD18DRAFT_449314 [Armillaria luteobubalina]|uniref:Uncharacterized protein n=1 Tax=Armillaria luteobubalina TaxID=153913 RepID=A0AA39PZJ6_9AGAR|nr:hypothetical protein EDD18DRAFT_449314 [Armillaria luteobubalina]
MPPGAKSVRESSSKPPLHKQDQFHHAIPRFILRGFQVGRRMTASERDREYKRTGVYPEYVLYYDLASGCLDVRSTGNIYGHKNLYRDASNLSNANEIEDKLGNLERQASNVIKTLHSKLASGKITLKRRDVERVRKFLFVMHYRNMGKSYFDPDHPHGGSTIRQWLECYKTKHSCQTHTDVWLHVLRYYLDTPHSEILGHARAIYNEHGMGKVHLQMMTNLDPDMEHSEALAYDMQASACHLGIWEAHSTSEFILSNNAFGLFEGLSVTGDQVHRIFVISPQIAVILRSNLMFMYKEMGPVNSELLKIPQHLPEPKYVNEDQIPSVTDLSSAMDVVRLRSPEDSITFTVTKLSLAQTDALNAVILKNADHDGAITFLRKERMLRTVRAFCHDPMNKYDRPKFTSLIRHLSVIPTEAIAQASLSYNPVDTELYVTLMDILLCATPFPSHYDCALSVFSLVKDASLRMTCLFMLEHIFNISAVMQKCQDHFGGDVYRAIGVSITLQSSLSEEVSSQVFEGLDRFISDKLGVGMAYDSSDALGQVGKEVVLVAFLDWIVDESAHVLEELPTVTMKAFQIHKI